MEVLFHLNDVSLLLLGTACLSAMALQGAHLFVLALWRESPMRVGTLVYEALLMVHLLLASVILREACANYAYVSLWSRSFCVPAIDASWVNVAPVLWGTILALVARRPIMVAELVVMACWLPPFVWLLGSAWPWVVAIGVAFMTSRSLACVALDYRRGGELVTRFSLAEVVNTAQEGILCYKADGRILVMNDAMRGLLETLGCRSVLVDACEVRRILLSNAREIHECMLDANGDVGEAWITAPNSTRWRLVFDVVRLGMGHCGRVIATDVTELMKLNEELDATNAELALVEDHLRASLAVVDATAELDALAHMRARVHDVIGQRLSILHRALEDRDLSRSHLGDLREMVDTIMADLAMREQADPKADLMSVIEAFELIGVSIDVSGSLPDCDEVADAFVRVVREAVTNAVRHARDYGRGEARIDGRWCGFEREGRASRASGMLVSVDLRQRHAAQGGRGVWVGHPGHAPGGGGGGRSPVRGTDPHVYGARGRAPPRSWCRGPGRRGRRAMRVIRVVVVEDQTMLRDSLVAAINRELDMEVVASLADAADVLGVSPDCEIDVALLDVCTENNSSGIIAARKLREARPQVKTVIMTGMSDVTFVRQAREAGVDSFIYKNVGTDDLLSVIRSTVEGYSTFPSSRKGDASEVELLDELELKILYLTCQAKSRREIAAALYMSEGTVKRRISEMLAKTGYDNLLKLAVRAVSSGSIAVNVDR